MTGEDFAFFCWVRHHFRYLSSNMHDTPADRARGLNERMLITWRLEPR